MRYHPLLYRSMTHHGFEEGDMVLLYSQRESFLVRINGEIARLRGRRGAVSTDRMIGAEEGSRLEIASKSFTLIRPDIRDIQENLERGPQIIVPKDSSMIVLGLGLSSGMNVLEGGAGSGALTTVLLNAVSPEGTVVTYDIKKEHLEKAGRNVARTPWEGSWDPRVGDIAESLPGMEMDAAVVDVPEPEICIEKMADVLKIGGRFCSYVPTTNQMERVHGALSRTGFTSIEALEIVQRPYSVKKGAVRPVHEILAHTGFLVFARWPGII
ncbi:MAG: tRNA (adenine-N1)-methyltransferase [Thermoplasmatota archaeon]